MRQQMSQKHWSQYSIILSDIKVDHLVAGTCGGVVSTAILHPLDLIKVRLQVNDGLSNRPQYRGAVHCARELVTANGLRGLYQGVVPNMWGAGLSWGFYFFLYNNVKNWMQKGDAKVSLGPGQHMLAAAESGLLTLALTNPIWLAKTRLCLQYEAPASRPYTGMFDALRKIYKAEGLRGLYKGFLPGIFGVSHGAMQFMAYEELKKLHSVHKNIPIDTRLGPLEYIAFAAISKMFAVVTTYPYQVVRSRLQEQHRSYNGMMSVIKETWRSEGPIGFYKGLAPNLVRVTPACCLTFLCYETIITYWRR